MRRIWRGLVVVGLAVALLVAGVVVWTRVTAPVVASLPALADGDLVFQTDRSAQMLAIFLATGSVYTHVGVIEVDPSGVPFVLEAAAKVRRISLADWLSHGYGRRVLIERLPGLAPAVGAQVAAKAAGFIGTPYDIFFRFGADRLYCSELVYDAFLLGGHVELGRVQSVSDLNIDNFAVRRIIRMRWRRDPECQPAGAMDFAACFARILRQQIITPVSLAQDARLQVVYSNYGVLGRI